MGGEAEPFTDVKTGIGDFEWSPDGRSIAFTMADAKSEDEEKNDKGRNDFRWVNEIVRHSRLYVIPVARDAAGKREPRKLTAENRHVTGFNWSPDGARIVFNHVSTSSANDWPSSDISFVDLDSARVTPLAATSAAESALHFSPDGKWIYGDRVRRPVRGSGLFDTIFPPARPAKSISRASRQPAKRDRWSPDGTKIFFYESKGTGRALYFIDAATGKITEVIIRTRAVSGVNMTRIGQDYALAMVVQRPDAPPEAFALVRPQGLTQVSHANDAVAKMPVGKTEVIKWKSTDGRDIEGLLTYPVGYTAGTKVPLILNIHGGPAGVFQQSYIGGRGSYPIATFASRGYAVLRPNPRGSSGYGTEFRRRI